MTEPKPDLRVGFGWEKADFTQHDTMSTVSLGPCVSAISSNGTMSHINPDLHGVEDVKEYVSWLRENANPKTDKIALIGGMDDKGVNFDGFKNSEELITTLKAELTKAGFSVVSEDLLGTKQRNVVLHKSGKIEITDSWDKTYSNKIELPVPAVPGSEPAVMPKAGPHIELFSQKPKAGNAIVAEAAPAPVKIDLFPTQSQAAAPQHIILDEAKLMKGNLREGGVYAEKKAVVAGLTNTTGKDIKFDVIMRDGTQETMQSMTLPAGATIVVQPNGELNMPVKKGAPIFDKLYDVNAKFSDSGTAKKTAGERGVGFTDNEALDRAMQHLSEKNPGLNVDEMKVGYYPAKGKLEMMRLSEEMGDVLLPKASWESVQKNKGGDVIAFNPISDEYYMINKTDGTLDTFVDPTKPGQSVQELYESLPILSPEKLKVAMADIPPDLTVAGKPMHEIANEVLQAQIAEAKALKAATAQPAPPTVEVAAKPIEVVVATETPANKMTVSLPDSETIVTPKTSFKTKVQGAANEFFFGEPNPNASAALQVMGLAGSSASLIQTATGTEPIDYVRTGGDLVQLTSGIAGIASEARTYNAISALSKAQESGSAASIASAETAVNSAKGLSRNLGLATTGIMVPLDIYKATTAFRQGDYYSGSQSAANATSGTLIGVSVLLGSTSKVAAACGPAGLVVAIGAQTIDIGVKSYAIYEISKETAAITKLNKEFDERRFTPGITSDFIDQAKANAGAPDKYRMQLPKTSEYKNLSDSIQYLREQGHVGEEKSPDPKALLKGIDKEVAILEAKKEKLASSHFTDIHDQGESDYDRVKTADGRASLLHERAIQSTFEPAFLGDNHSEIGNIQAVANVDDRLRALKTAREEITGDEKGLVGGREGVPAYAKRYEYAKLGQDMKPQLGALANDVKQAEAKTSEYAELKDRVEKLRNKYEKAFGEKIEDHKDYKQTKEVVAALEKTHQNAPNDVVIEATMLKTKATFIGMEKANLQYVEAEIARALDAKMMQVETMSRDPIRQKLATVLAIEEKTNPALITAAQAETQAQLEFAKLRAEQDKRVTEFERTASKGKDGKPVKANAQVAALHKPGIQHGADELMLKYVDVVATATNHANNVGVTTAKMLDGMNLKPETFALMASPDQAPAKDQLPFTKMLAAASPESYAKTMPKLTGNEPIQFQDPTLQTVGKGTITTHREL